MYDTLENPCESIRPYEDKLWSSKLSTPRGEHEQIFAIRISCPGKEGTFARKYAQPAAAGMFNPGPATNVVVHTEKPVPDGAGVGRIVGTGTVGGGGPSSW
jgi:hypothetical protein